MGQNSLDPEIKRRHVINVTEDLGQGVGGNHRTEGGKIGAQVGADARAYGEKLSVVIERDFRLADVVAPVGVGEKRVAAIADPFHRPADLFCREQHQRLLRISDQLHTEAAADVVGHHADL